MMTMTMTIPTMKKMTMRTTDKSQGNWYPACGGTEVPFVTRTGKKLLYVWQPSTGNHAYLNCETDLILSDEDARFALQTY